MALTIKNLPERQQELNRRVQEAVSKNVNFDDIKDAPEVSILDKLFKIDVASKYKRIDYLIDVLKSGNPVCVTRAMKSQWLYDAEYAHIICPEYLHREIFPLMAVDMKNKLLSSIATHVRDHARSEGFYKYCAENGLADHASKFLLLTSEEFKLGVIRKDGFSFLQRIAGNSKGPNISNDRRRGRRGVRKPNRRGNQGHTLYEEKKSNFIVFFIGNSFTLFETLLARKETMEQVCDFLQLCSYLYSVNSDRYLDILERKIMPLVDLNKTRQGKISLNMSRNIMKKNKNRVLENPAVYINVLNMNIVLKSTTVDDAKKYISALLPSKSWNFWHHGYFSFLTSYNRFFDLIPRNERLEFIKTIFNTKYPNEKFEVTLEFYQEKLYKLMTAEQREAWAISHIESGKELLGPQNDYIWYRFVNFEKAFPEIKKLILVSPEPEKRSALIDVLVESAKTHQNLEALLSYYYQRHVNESREHKITFVDKFLEKHYVYNFNIETWTPFEKLLYSMDVFNGEHIYQKYELITLLYYVINEKEIPAEQHSFMFVNLHFYRVQQELSRVSHRSVEDLSVIKEDPGWISSNQSTTMKVYYFFLKVYVEKLKELMALEYVQRDDVEVEVDDIVPNKNFVSDMFSYFSRNCRKRRRQAAQYKEAKQKKMSQVHLLQLLKNNSKLVLEEFPEIINNVNNHKIFKLNTFLRKLRIYFTDDLAKEYLERMLNLLTDEDNNNMQSNSIFAAVHCLFSLGDEAAKTEFLNTFAPVQSKIDHREIDVKKLKIQEAICKFAHYSQPPVPSQYILKYVTGDYASYCENMFGVYAATLPPNMCIEFVQPLLNTPVSIQKRALRLAFACFDRNNLKNLIKNSWKRSKNISLRMVIYTSLLNKISTEGSVNDLYNVFKALTMQLNEDDHEKVIEILTNYNAIPEKFRGDYLAIAYSVVCAFPENTVNMGRIVAVLKGIVANVNLISKEDIHKIVDDYLKSKYVAKEVSDVYIEYKYSALVDAKDELIRTYLVKYDHDPIQSKLQILKLITKSCSERWSEKTSKEVKLYIFRKYLNSFITSLLYKIRVESNENFATINPILEAIVDDLTGSFPLRDVYITLWDLKLTRISNKVTEQFRDLIARKIDVNFETIADIFTAELVTLIIDFKTRNQYYSTLVREIVNRIQENVNFFIGKLRVCFPSIVANDFIMLVSVGLTKVNTLQTYTLAAILMPMYVPTFSLDEYKGAIRAITTYEDVEVQMIMYDKLRNDDNINILSNDE